MKILITGILGYIGSRLAILTRDKHEITGIDNGYAAQISKIDGIDLYNLDIRDHKKIESIASKLDLIVHLAAISGVDTCKKNPLLAHDVNTLATINLAWICRQNQIPLIFPTSMAMLGDPVKFPIDEKHPRKPKNIYGYTKYIAEQNINLYAQNSFPAIMFMTSNIYGHHIIDGKLILKNTVINKFIGLAKNGKPLTVYSPGTQARDFLHLEDTVRAYIDVINKINEFKNEALTMTLASGKSTQMNDIAEIIFNEAQKRGYKTKINLIKNPRNNETLTDNFKINISKIEELINFKPMFTIQSGIKEIFDLKY